MNVFALASRSRGGVHGWPVGFKEVNERRARVSRYNKDPEFKKKVDEERNSREPVRFSASVILDG
jgi:hypothetical protein